MFHKVKHVTPLPDFRLFVEFVNGERKEYNVAPLFDRWSAFVALKSTAGLFGQVRTDPGGYGISWNDEIDLSCDELYENGVQTL